MPFNLFGKKKKKSIKQRFVQDDTPKACSLCDYNEMVKFSWKEFQMGSNPELKQFGEHLKYLHPVKFGHLYQCPNNKIYWYRDDAMEIVRKVPDTCSEMFLTWTERWCKLTFPQINVLGKIGGKKPENFKYRNGAMIFVCKITRPDGSVHNPAVALVTNQSPIEFADKQCILGHADDVIEETSIVPQQIDSFEYFIYDWFEGCETLLDE
jgi:hypothetical protein